MSIEIAVRTNSMAYAEDFRRINEDWISANFWLEESDIQVLSNPQKYILDKGSNMISNTDRNPYSFANQSALICNAEIIFSPIPTVLLFAEWF